MKLIWHPVNKASLGPDATQQQFALEPGRLISREGELPPGGGLPGKAGAAWIGAAPTGNQEPKKMAIAEGWQ